MTNINPEIIFCLCCPLNDGCVLCPWRNSPESTTLEKLMHSDAVCTPWCSLQFWAGEALSFNCKNIKASVNLNLCYCLSLCRIYRSCSNFFPLTLFLGGNNGKPLYLCVLPIIFCCRFAHLKCALAEDIVFYRLLLTNCVSGCRMTAWSVLAQSNVL